MRPGLERALQAGDVGGVEAELTSGAIVDSLDRHGQTALMLAAHKGHLAVIECLVRHGANLDVRAKFGLSASRFYQGRRRYRSCLSSSSVHRSIAWSSDACFSLSCRREFRTWSCGPL